MFLVCLLAVLLSGFSIYSTYQMRLTASMIYAHPYTVSSESPAMRSRLLDMKSFLLNIIAEPSSDVEGIQQLLRERYDMQHAAIEVIQSQYLGPAEDTAALDSAMQALKEAQTAALPHVLPMNREETAQYVIADLYPKYDAVNDVLGRIISFADDRVRGWNAGRPARRTGPSPPPCCSRSFCPPISSSFFGGNARASARCATVSTASTSFPPTWTRSS